MAGLEASLNNHEGFFVLRRIENLNEIEQVISTTVDPFTFDKSLPESKIIEGLFASKTGILVMGIDMSPQHLTLFSKEGSPIENFLDLANHIHKQASS